MSIELGQHTLDVAKSLVSCVAGAKEDCGKQIIHPCKGEAGVKGHVEIFNFAASVS